ncbi:MAG: 50S ribosomal protein L24 [Nanoarchaeota archaeon]|nr:50S ribosomal protein L24 [Nanoarchaeota archaeon]MBU1004866.1 50S ribosomal protein L24 [Nanoarchaeota archaeon]MBU1946322.1 50S ribosomal protein L24 [Nanoarchaeota archaeon]
MKKLFSTAWKSSSQKRKQRKYRHNAPLHIKQKFVHVHLSKELLKKYKKRNLGLKKGDKVTVVRGQFKKHQGTVDRIDLKKTRVYLTGIEITRKDGTKSTYPIHPSNLIITELSLDDKNRQKIIERKGK